MKTVYQRYRTRSTTVAALLAALGAFVIPSAGQACKIDPGNTPFKLDDSVMDSIPPGAVAASVAHVQLATNPGPGPGDCSDLTFVTLNVASSDDQTPSEQLGYQVVRLEGSFLPIESGPVLPRYGVLGYAWAPSDLCGFSTVLGVSAVDLAGNVGPMTRVEITAEGDESCDPSGACSISGQSRPEPWSLGLFLLAGLAWVWRRKNA